MRTARGTYSTILAAWTACAACLGALAGCSEGSEVGDADPLLDGGAGAAGSAGSGGGGTGGSDADAAPACGNGAIDVGEQCDDGTNAPGSGCEPDCTTSCQDHASCDDDEACNGVETCSSVASGKRCAAGTALADGSECAADPRQICVAGACRAPSCGDGVVDEPSGEQCEPPNTATCTAACLDVVCGDGKIEGAEECDDGTNAAGSGCEPDCTLTCEQAADCSDGEECNGAETCEPVAGGRVCVPGAPLADGESCTTGYCRNAACVQPVCGNDEVEPGETCEPPGSATCSSTCQVVVCGDGVIGGNEDCDDGNALRLDGCAPDCRYEMVSRFTSLVIQKGPAPAHCKHAGSREGGNAYGAAFSEAALINSNGLIGEAIEGGSSNIMSTMMDLDDRTAQNDPTVRIGVVEGDLDLRHSGTFTPGAVDWWFLAAAKNLDENDLPRDFLSPATIVDGVLNAGPSNVRVSLKLGEIIHPVELLDTQVRARTPSTQPTSRPAPPPSLLAPDFTIYDTTIANGPDEGLCAMLSVDGLSKFPVPRQFTSGDTACNPGCEGSAAYVACPSGEAPGPSCNSLLDVFVNGCRANFLCIDAVTPMQPDVGTGKNPPATLTPSGPLKKVEPVVPTDGYSIYFHFTMRRAHLTNNL